MSNGSLEMLLRGFDPDKRIVIFDPVLNIELAIEAVKETETTVKIIADINGAVDRLLEGD